MTFAETDDDIGEVIKRYNDFQEKLLKAVRSEKYLNNFLQNIPSTT